MADGSDGKSVGVNSSLRFRAKSSRVTFYWSKKEKRKEKILSICSNKMLKNNKSSKNIVKVHARITYVYEDLTRLRRSVILLTTLSCYIINKYYFYNSLTSIVFSTLIFFPRQMYQEFTDSLILWNFEFFQF